MVKAKQIKFSEHAYNERVYCFPKTKLLSDQGLEHEKLCGDLYTAFHPDYWKCPAEADDFGIKPDRIMIHFGKLVFWEADRNTEGYLTRIREKLEKYVQLSESNPEKRFHVIFTTVDYRQSAESRCKGLLEMFQTFKRGDQFLTTKHEWACKFPDGAAFLSPISLMGVAIKDAK